MPMNEWDFIESMILGEDDPELEELERSIDPDAPMVRLFCGADRSTRERLIRAFKMLPVVLGMVLICPFWLLYEEYLLPLYWKIEEWAEWQQSNGCCEPIRFTEKEKKEMLICGMVCSVLLIILIYLYYLMEKSVK